MSFSILWKSLGVKKGTVNEIINELSERINYLTLYKLPSAGDRETRQILEEIQQLKDKRNALKKQYGKESKSEVVLDSVLPEETAKAESQKYVINIAYATDNYEHKRRDFVVEADSEDEAKKKAKALYEREFPSQGGYFFEGFYGVSVRKNTFANFWKDINKDELGALDEFVSSHPDLEDEDLIFELMGEFSISKEDACAYLSTKYGKDFGVANAGPVPESLLAVQDLEGTTEATIKASAYKVVSMKVEGISVWALIDQNGELIDTFTTKADAEDFLDTKKSNDAGQSWNCLACNGTGRVGGGMCYTCDGTGIVPEEKSQVIKEKSIEVGDRVKVIGGNNFQGETVTIVELSDNTSVVKRDKGGTFKIFNEYLQKSQINKAVTCPTCHGSGTIGTKSIGIQICQMCDGTGYVSKDPTKIKTSKGFNDEMDYRTIHIDIIGGQAEFRIKGKTYRVRDFSAAMDLIDKLLFTDTNKSQISKSRIDSLDWFQEADDNFVVIYRIDGKPMKEGFNSRIEAKRRYDQLLLGKSEYDKSQIIKTSQQALDRADGLISYQNRTLDIQDLIADGFDPNEARKLVEILWNTKKSQINKFEEDDLSQNDQYEYRNLSRSQQKVYIETRANGKSHDTAYQYALETNKSQVSKGFTIEPGKEVLRLSPGNYEVISNDLDTKYVGNKMYSMIDVKNIKTGQVYSIPKGNAQMIGLIPMGKSEKSFKDFWKDYNTTSMGLRGLIEDILDKYGDFGSNWASQASGYLQSKGLDQYQIKAVLEAVRDSNTELD